MSPLKILDGRLRLKPIEDPWEACTAEGMDYEQLQLMAGRTMLERLEWAMTMTQLARRGREQAEERRKAAKPPGDG